MTHRARKRIGYHWVYATRNDHGEWSIRVDPGGLQIDNYHRGSQLHLHYPGEYNKTLELPGMDFERANAIVRRHLAAHDGIDFDRLARELMKE